MTRLTMAILVALALALSTVGAQEATSTTSSAAPAASAMVNLNTASLAQLETLPGVGRTIAERIVEYRERNGGFKRAEDLMNVRGVGEQSFLRLRPLVTVGAPPAERAAPGR